MRPKRGFPGFFGEIVQSFQLHGIERWYIPNICWKLAIQPGTTQLRCAENNPYICGKFAIQLSPLNQSCTSWGCCPVLQAHHCIGTPHCTIDTGMHLVFYLTISLNFSSPQSFSKSLSFFAFSLEDGSSSAAFLRSESAFPLLPLEV